jgi:indoleamine 2,3-dioxygenase
MASLFKQFEYDKETTAQTPAFIVTPENGFLPRVDPIELPKKYEALTNLLDNMSVQMPDGSAGLLGQGNFGAECEKLPLYDFSDVDDQLLLMALFRDYTFITSAYLLEPCDILNRSKGSYGPGRKLLPKNIAVPLQQLSDKIKAKPFMEYAQSYALYNYKRKDVSKPLDYDNLELIRKVCMILI